MKLVPARVHKRGEFSAAGSSSGAEPELGSGAEAPGRARVVTSQVVAAAEQAQAILRRAEARAREIGEEAERSHAEARLEAEAEARAAVTAELAARSILLRSAELKAAETNLDRLVHMARLLAERILGEELRLEPERIVALARQALNEARGARQIVIEAEPEDAALLEGSLDALGVAGGSVHIRPVATRQRGDLKVLTEAGALDAALSPQLERLTEKLREALRS